MATATPGARRYLTSCKPQRPEPRISWQLTMMHMTLFFFFFPPPQRFPPPLPSCGGTARLTHWLLWPLSPRAPHTAPASFLLLRAVPGAPRGLPLGTELRLTSLVLVDAQRQGDALEGPLVAGPHPLGRPPGLGPAGLGPAALGGHEGAAGEALAEPGEEQPQLAGHEAQQGEGGDERVGEVVQAPLLRRRRPGAPGGPRCSRRPRRRHGGSRPGLRGGGGRGAAAA